MKLPLKHILTGLALLGALVGLYLKTNRIVFTEHTHFNEGLNRLRQLDATLNQDILRARFHMLEDYDGFPRQINEQKIIVGNLAAIPSFIPQAGRHLIEQKVHELSELVTQKAELLERFKSQNAILNNSLRYLPVTGAELARGTANNDPGRELQALLNGLMRQVLVYSLEVNDEQTPEIYLSLDKLNQWRLQYGDEAQDAALGSMAAHAISIVRRTPKLDAFTKQLLSLPIPSQTEAVQGAYDGQFAVAMRAAALFRVALYALCALLVFGIGYTIFALAAANAHLERRVGERTGDLSRKNEELGLKTAFLEALVDSSPDGILVVDQEGNCSLRNQRFIDLFKMPSHIADEMGDENRLRWVRDTTDDPEQFGEKVAYLYSHPNETSRDEIKLKDGTTLDRYSSPVFGKDGKYHGRIWTFRDVTARKQRENALRESNEKFHQLADNLADVFWVASPDFHTMHFVSAGYEGVWGRSVGSLYADPHEWFEAILPEDRERVFALSTALRGEEPTLSVEYRISRPDGTVRWVHDRGFQVRDAVGAVVRLAGIVSDITERKCAEEELFQSRETLRGILDHIPQRVFWKDRNLVYVGCNRAFALDMGFNDPSEVIGKTDFEAGWKAVAEIYRADDRSVIDLDKGKFSYEEPAISADGSPGWLRTSKSPLHDLQGRVIGVLGTYEDITEHKLARLEIESLNSDLERRVAQRTQALLAATEEAKHANAAKSEFLSRMSHELRTPLNAILGFGQLLERDGRDPEEADNIGQILKAGAHLLALVDEVLEISDIEAGTLDLAIQSCHLGEVIEEALAESRPLAVEREVALGNFACDRRVLIDRRRFKHVVFNLLSNAIKFNRQGGTVELAARDTGGGWLRLAITDKGLGIAAQDTPKIFMVFERLGVANQVGGIGLGLAISKRLVELMGCRIGVESALGEGSTFWIEMPLAERPIASLDQSALLSIRNSQSAIRNSKTLLYIEENLSNLRLITRILARRPAIQLLSAKPDALRFEMAREHLPDLIVIDLHPADNQGGQMLAMLRADPRTSGIPVVILGADDLPEMRERMLSAGARVFLTNPVAVRSLLGVLDQFIEFRPDEIG